MLSLLSSTAPDFACFCITLHQATTICWLRSIGFYIRTIEFADNASEDCCGPCSATPLLTCLPLIIIIIMMIINTFALPSYQALHHPTSSNNCLLVMQHWLLHQDNRICRHCFRKMLWSLLSSIAPDLLAFASPYTQFQLVVAVQ